MEALSSCWATNVYPLMVVCQVTFASSFNLEWVRKVKKGCFLESERNRDVKSSCSCTRTEKVAEPGKGRVDPRVRLFSKEPTKLIKILNQ